MDFKGGSGLCTRERADLKTKDHLCLRETRRIVKIEITCQGKIQLLFSFTSASLGCYSGATGYARRRTHVSWQWIVQNTLKYILTLDYDFSEQEMNIKYSFIEQINLKSNGEPSYGIH